MVDFKKLLTKKLPEPTKCYKCQGHGIIQHGNKMFVMCPVCRIDYTCTKCYGTGKYYESYYDEYYPCTCSASKSNCTKCNNTGEIPDSYFGYVKCDCNNKKTKKNPILVEDKGGYKLANATDNIKYKNNPNLVIVPAKDNEIQIDYDYEDIPEQFEKVCGILRQRFPKGKITWDKFRSSSGKHWHVVIKLPEAITDQERILWQAVFGSDYMREGLNILRQAFKINEPILLYMNKNAVPEETGEVPEKPARKFKEIECH